ncbi:hypothetical protein BCR34DRAFT_558437 [Clohesyomyces aquaticus]|uniref:C2H2-type domain-containing protein n=1 Tax=Clohesyomyces aquaticus TaxID=1231657 RepID=A0A1Y1ZZN2_9PLEO|nr:hypothetical protein BCR34DRAFT_558437 [Clohesyomyces aquaticus]
MYMRLNYNITRKSYDTPEGPDERICKACGREYRTKRGLHKHKYNCHRRSGKKGRYVYTHIA